jgi:GH15 family glucan-1,4-alpha-glucosidase
VTEVAGQNLDLGVVGNCQVSALVDGRGRVVWMCLPRPDGDPVFCALLSRRLGDSQHGIFAVDIKDLVSSEQHYLRNSAILETVLTDARGGKVRIRDFCPRFRARGRMFRPMMFVRVVEPVANRPLVRFRLHPAAGYGARPAEARSGSHHLRFMADGIACRVTTNASLSALAENHEITLEGPLAFILGPDETLDEQPSVLAGRLIEETRSYWQDWVRTLAIPFDWQEEVIRAAITLKLCTYEDTGAVLAALTTSIPESPNSGRTWDYRYCWLRDSYFVVQALNRLGATRTMEGYLHYIDRIVARSGVNGLQPLYSITGDSSIEERLIPTLEGFLGMGPVRAGNQAALQTQNDIYGAVILAASQLFFDQRLASPGDHALFAQLQELGEHARLVYELPDAGLWEFRGIAQAHTFSAAMSWAGCDRLARISTRLDVRPTAARWRACADSMRDRILARAWSDRRQTFAGSLGGEQLDASVLLLPELGLLAATDPRFQQTVDVIGRELRDGDLLFRYRHVDDFGMPETAFAICAFWYVNALAACGRRDEAREQFSTLLTRRNRVGLLSEDIDPRSGTLWGNFPQTYSHVGIISSAMRLSRAWEDAF